MLWSQIVGKICRLRLDVVANLIHQTMSIYSCTNREKVEKPITISYPKSLFLLLPARTYVGRQKSQTLHECEIAICAHNASASFASNEKPINDNGITLDGLKLQSRSACGFAIDSILVPRMSTATHSGIGKDPFLTIGNSLDHLLNEFCKAS